MKRIIIFLTMFVLVFSVSGNRKFPVTEEEWYLEYQVEKRNNGHNSDYMDQNERTYRILLEVINMRIDKLVAEMRIDESHLKYPPIQPKFWTSAWKSWYRHNIDVENAGERIYMRLQNMQEAITHVPVNYQSGERPPKIITKIVNKGDCPESNWRGRWNGKF